MSLTRELNDMANLLTQVPLAASLGRPPIITQMHCGGCKKLVEAVDMPIIDTGVIHYISDRCRKCLFELKDLATIVCIPCRDVAGRWEPHVDKYGFIFEKGGHYHIRSCPKCARKLTPSTVIERDIFLQRKRGIKPNHTP